MENLLKLGSHEIVLRAEGKFFKKLSVIPVAITQQIQSVLIPYFIDFLNFSRIMYDICMNSEVVWQCDMPSQVGRL